MVTDFFFFAKTNDGLNFCFLSDLIVLSICIVLSRLVLMVFCISLKFDSVGFGTNHSSIIGLRFLSRIYLPTLSPNSPPILPISQYLATTMSPDMPNPTLSVEAQIICVNWQVSILNPGKSKS